MKRRRHHDGPSPDQPKFDRCGATRKLRYRTEAAATLGLAATHRRLVEELDHRRRERRAYPCDFCGGWHLTSTPERRTTEPSPLTKRAIS